MLLSQFKCTTAYTDNAIFVDKYPEPEGFTTAGVLISWGVMTLIGLLSYWFYSQSKFGFSYLLLSIYSVTGLSSPIHYLYGGLSQFSWKMHILIGLDASAGLTVLGFVIWSVLIAKEWYRIDQTQI